MRTLLLSCVGLLSPLCAQGLQLSTANVNPIAWHNAVWGYGGTWSLPLGPVSFPTQLGGAWNWVDMRLTATANSVSVDSFGQASWSSSTWFRTKSDLVTRFSMPAPARIGIRIDAQTSYTQIGSTSLPIAALGVDLDANGQDEFFSTAISSNTSTNLVAHCDSAGSIVRWHHQLDGPTTSGPGGFQATADLTLTFADPIQEATYGPACSGQLGCQLGNGSYDRIFVASLPNNTTFAWLMAGATQQNVLFPGIGCPLLVTPDVIVGVPLFPGPNGRKFVDLPATFPAWPGATWYAQCVAISAGTFVGTNGVTVQT